MARMEEVEDAVGENDRPGLPASPGQQLGTTYDLVACTQKSWLRLGLADKIVEAVDP
jgi:hypothetical protein